VAERCRLSSIVARDPCPVNCISANTEPRTQSLPKQTTIYYLRVV
jgi:hypothetical protein